MIQPQDRDAADGLAIQHRKGRRGDQDRGVQGFVLDQSARHRMAARHCARCLDMDHEHEDARHQVQHEIAANGRIAHPHDQIDQQKRHHEDCRLQDRQQQPDDRVAMVVAQVIDGLVIDQAQGRARRLDDRAVLSLVEQGLRPPFACWPSGACPSRPPRS